MAEQKESSVLFSLKELMNLEEDRIRQEEDDKQKKLQAEESARLDAERRQRDAETARVQAEDERRRQEEYRARQEAAALEAQRQGAIEAARVQAENIARMEAMRHQQEHERQLTHIKESSGKKKLVAVAGGITLLMVFGAIGAGVFIKIQNDKAALAAQIAEEERRKLQEENDRLKKEMKEADEAVADAKKAVEKAGSDAERKIAQAKLEEATKSQQQAAAKLGGGRVAVAGPGDKPKKQVCKQSNGAVVPSCADGDPLCSCTYQ